MQHARHVTGRIPEGLHIERRWDSQTIGLHVQKASAHHCRCWRLQHFPCNMYCCFVPWWFYLLAFHAHSSVNGQTPGKSMVSVWLKFEENTTDDVSDQEEEIDVITPKDRETMALVHIVTSPPLLVVGTFGNVMTIAIHKRSILTSPLSVFFIVLAVSDLGLLYSNCLTRWIFFAFNFNVFVQNSVLCKISFFILYVSGCLSAWTLVAMTAQRAVCVLWPHRANVLCRVGKSKVIVVSMILFISGIHTHLLYGYDVETSGSLILCVPVKDYMPFFFEIWSIVDMLIVSLLPWLCLAVCNSLLVWKLKVSIREAEVNLGPCQADRMNNRKKKVSSMTVTLVTVSVAFLTLTFPMSFIQILNFIFWTSGSIDVLNSSKVIYYAWGISFPLWYLNSCINFYVYCLTGSKFRKEAKQMLCCLFHEDIDKKVGNTTVSTLSSHRKT